MNLYYSACSNHAHFMNRFAYLYSTSLTLSKNINECITMILLVSSDPVLPFRSRHCPAGRCVCGKVLPGHFSSLFTYCVIPLPRFLSSALLPLLFCPVHLSWFSVQAPDFRLNPVRKLVPAARGGQVKMECKPRAAPKPTLFWSRGTELLTNSSR